jgi:mRNA interferase HigB
MVIILKAKLIEFYSIESKSKEAFLLWYNISLISDWNDFHAIKQTFNSVDAIGNDRFFLMLAAINTGLLPLFILVQEQCI